MRTDVRCGDPEALAGYLYTECNPAERLAMAAHLATCAACADEIAALQATRTQLAEWTPPETRLGFQVVADRPSAESHARSWWPWAGIPAWAQVAAAAVLLVVGAALANLHVSYDGAGVTMRIGSVTPMESTARATAVSARDLAALEERMRQEIMRARLADFTRTELARSERATTSPERPASTVPPGTGNTPASDLMLRVRELIAASEQRQQRELALRVADVVRDVETQRRADLARFEQTVGQMEGVTGEEILQQRQMLNYLMRVSQGQR